MSETPVITELSESTSAAASKTSSSSDK
jgi:hypothetical protein